MFSTEVEVNLHLGVKSISGELFPAKSQFPFNSHCNWIFGLEYFHFDSHAPEGILSSCHRHIDIRFISLLDSGDFLLCRRIDGGERFSASALVPLVVYK